MEVPNPLPYKLYASIMRDRDTIEAELRFVAAVRWSILARYNDIRAYTTMNASNLEILSSEEYSGARRDSTTTTGIARPTLCRVTRTSCWPTAARAVPAGRPRSAVDGVGSGDRRERRSTVPGRPR
jgi:hypothetical protein